MIFFVSGSHGFWVNFFSLQGNILRQCIKLVYKWLNQSLGVFCAKKIELEPTTAEQSAEHTVPRLSHHPVSKSVKS